MVTGDLLFQGNAETSPRRGEECQPRRGEECQPRREEECQPTNNDVLGTKRTCDSHHLFLNSGFKEYLFI